MSHFVTIRTRIREKERLLEALRDLKFQFQEGQNLTVSGFAGEQAKADVVVDTGSSYQIGFRRREQEYEIIADWWGVEKKAAIRQTDFISQISQRYAYRQVLQQAREQYLVVEEEQLLEGGDIVLTLSERE
jgi:hypothetical protein